MLTTVFFDLDGTLLNLEVESFIASYIKMLAPRFDGMIAPDVFAKELMRWSYAMIENKDPGRTNLDVFWEGFPKALGMEREVLEPIFEDFYTRDFCRLRRESYINPSARELIRAVMEGGYTPVIATNPVFPKIAIMERLNWAGCDDFAYAYVTCGEEMHFCKPNLEFFTEVLEKIGRTPQESLMVGNDPEEDMVAQKLGFYTALVTDCLVKREKPEIVPDWEGSLAELAMVFKSGREKEIFNRA